MHTVVMYTHATHPKKLRDNQRIRLVYDEDHETEGSYGYETEEETKAAEDYELDMLAQGIWVVLGRIIEERCPHCGSWTETDALWGIVIENTREGHEQAAFEI